MAKTALEQTERLVVPQAVEERWLDTCVLVLLNLLQFVELSLTQIVILANKVKAWADDWVHPRDVTSDAQVGIGSHQDQCPFGAKSIICQTA